MKTLKIIGIVIVVLLCLVTFFFYRTIIEGAREHYKPETYKKIYTIRIAMGKHDIETWTNATHYVYDEGLYAFTFEVNGKLIIVPVTDNTSILIQEQ